MALKKRLARLLGSPGFVVVVAFLIRLALYYPFVVHFREPAVRDNLPYGAETGAVAAAIAEGRGFSSPLRFFHTGSTAWFTPIYPYLLAGIFKLFGVFTYKSALCIHVMNLAFSAFTCWPIAIIGTRAFGRKVGIAAAWSWVVLPTAVYFPIEWVWDMCLAALCMALLFAATLALRGSSRTSSWIGYGALWAVSSMINPSLLAVLPFLALWAIWPLLEAQFRHAVRLALASSVIFIICVSPWTIRNYVVFHKFIPFRSNLGLELWLGNNPNVPDTWTPFLHPNDDLDEGKKYARMTEIPYMEQKQSEAFTFMRQHPADAARFTFRRFENNWLGIWDAPADIWRSSSVEVKLMVAGSALFSLLSLAGVLFAYRESKEAALPMGLVLLIFPLIFYISHSSARYRFPMEPLMTILAVYAVVYPLEWLAKWAHRVTRRSEATVHTAG